MNKRYVIRALFKILRIASKILAVFIALLLLLVALLNIPAVQTYITEKISNRLSEQTGTVMRVGAVKIAFPKTVHIKEVYVEDLENDTLLFLGSLKVNVDLPALINRKINVKSLRLNQLRANVERSLTDSAFNFQFIIDSLTSPQEPDTTPSKPWNFAVRDIYLSDFDVDFRDELSGIDAGLDLGTLNLFITDTDIDSLRFGLKNITLANTSARLVQWNVPGAQTETETAEESSSQLPQISLGEFNITGVDIYYHHKDEESTYEARVGDLDFEPEQIDLNGKVLDLGTLMITNSEVSIATMKFPEPASSAAAPDEEPLERISDILPEWNLTMDQLSLENLNLSYDIKNIATEPHGFDPNHIALSNIQLELNDVQSSPANASLNLDELSFTSQSGINLKQLVLKAGVSEGNLDIDWLSLQFNNSNLDAEIHLSYASLGSLIENPEHAGVSLNIGPSRFHVGDAFLIAPQLAQDSLLRIHRNRTIQFTANAGGNLGNIDLENLEISVAGNTRLAAGGIIRGLPEAKNLAFDFSLDSLVTTDDDLRALIDTSYFSGMNLPASIALSFSAEGTTDSLDAVAELQTSLGGFTAEAMFRDRGKQLRDTFHVQLSIPALDAGRLLADTTMGKLVFETQLSGSGATTDSIQARLDGALKSLRYNDYEYTNIKIVAVMAGDSITANINSNDENLDFTINGEAVADSAYQHLMAQLTLRKLDLQKLNFSEGQFVAKTNIYADVRFGGITDLDARVDMNDTEIVQNKKFFQMQNLVMDAVTTSDSTTLTLTSDYVDVTALANIRADSLQPLLSHAVRRYISRDDTISLPDEKHLQASIDVHMSDEMKERMLPGLETLRINTLEASYSSDNNELKVDVLLPRTDYSGLNIDSLYFSVNGKADSLSMSAGFKSLAYDTIGMDGLRLQGELVAGTLLSNISVMDVNRQPAYLLSNEIQLHRDSILISFQPEGLMMDGGKWSIDEDNKLVVRGNRIEASGFSFSKENQGVSLVQAEDSIYLKFDHFRIGNLINVINVNKRHDVIAGKINGIISLPQKDTLTGGFKAKIIIDSLMLMDSLAGDLHFAIQDRQGQLKVDVSLINPYNQLALKGTMATTGETPKLDLQADVEITALERFERFTFGQLSQLSGSILGDIKINGTMDNPLINGKITFKNTAFNINSLNFYTELNNESIRFNRQGIHLNEFTILGPNDNALEIDGSLLTEDYSFFRFDLSVQADHFQPVNSTDQDNERFYGDLFITTTTKITGNSNLPVIDATLEIEEGTDLTYVLPGSEISMVDHEGIVQFTQPTFGGDTVSIRNETAYLTDSVVRRVEGINLDAKIILDPEANFTVVVDQMSGDYATVQGVTDLNFSIDQSGTRSMTGVFEVRDGFYQVSFYGLIKKKFLFQPGSTISWSGRLMDAGIDFTATHIVRTQSVNLIASESTGMSEAERNMYKQRLPYEVLLNIDGFLSEPEISFGLDLPQKYQVNYPQIATKLSMLNSDQMASELNKQVFALLVTGSFIPDNPFASGEGGSQGIATTAARNSVNGILSAQLNKLSSKYVKGFEVNFDLTTYDEYSAGTSQTRTELDVEVQKTLFDDRLTVEASSTFNVEGDQGDYPGGRSQQLYGEFAVTYDLTESGDYKIRAYRENAYDIFDGEVAYSGLAFIIQKSFNKLKNIFKRDEPNQEAVENEEDEDDTKNE